MCVAWDTQVCVCVGNTISHVSAIFVVVGVYLGLSAMLCTEVHLLRWQ